MISEFLTRLRFLILRMKGSEVDDEIRFHLGQAIAAKEGAGLSPSEARRQAGNNATRSALVGGWIFSLAIYGLRWREQVAAFVVEDKPIANRID